MASRILAIDPGTRQSAWCGWEPAYHRIRGFGILANEELLRRLRITRPDSVHVLVIEKVSSYGNTIGSDVLETVYWSGQFAEAIAPIPTDRIFRKTVVAHLTGSGKKKDTDVRQSLINRFGGDLGKAAAIGVKAKPGPLYGISKDVWSALAVAIAYADGAR